MREFLMRIIICIVAGIFCVSGIINSSGEILMSIFAFGLIISFIFLIRCTLEFFSQKITKREISHWVFIFFEVISVISVSIYAVYDLNLREGWLPGLTGYLVLRFVVPVFVVFAIIDFVFLISKKKDG